MPKGLVNESSLNSIGTAINVLNGTEGTYSPSEMGEAIINAIPTETASGNPINITDAAAYPAESVVTTLEPVQDLHGYDKPWPAGGGKNLFDATIEQGTFNPSTGQPEDHGQRVRSDYILLNAGTYTISNSNKNEVLYVYDINKNFISAESITSWSSGITLSFELTQDRYVRFAWRKPDNSSLTPSDVANIQLELGTTATTYEPYSNECPISGHTGAELTQCQTEYARISSWNDEDNGLIITNINNHVTVKGTANATDGVVVTPHFISSSSKILVNNPDGIEWFLWNFSKHRNEINRNFRKTGKYNITANDEYSLAIRPEKNITYDYEFDYRIYDADNLISHSVTFPQAQSPVYGCDVDWVNGVLRVTKWKDVLSSWVRNSGTSYYSTLSHVAVPDQLSNLQVISDKAETATSGSAKGVFINANRAAQLNTVKEYATATEMITDFGGSIEVVYELATPIEILLTPEVITLLKGENNVWTDAGTSEIEYKVDLQTYLDELTAGQASQSSQSLNLSPLNLRGNAEINDTSEDEPMELVSTDGEDVGEIEEVDEPVVYDKLVESEPVDEIGDAT